MEKSLEKLVSKFYEEFFKKIEHVEVIKQKEPIYKELKRELSPKIQEYLRNKGYRLYAHQVDAIENIRDGKNIIISTSTSSGKSLAFNIPIFEVLSENEKATALYLYPTKALTNDQLKMIREFEKCTGILVGSEIYDGDTPSDKRNRIIKSSRIILSNPYELHNILRLHLGNLGNFITRLKFVVVDEAHHYRGVFGSNVALLFRRFRRICDFHGSNPQFILSSATIANPVEFSEKLVGINFTSIECDGSPKAKKYFIFFNPYYDGIGELSTHRETEKLVSFFVKNNLQTLCFTISRKMAELITKWIKENLEKIDPSLKHKVAAYRAGYLPDDRREIEKKLKNGILKAVVSTNALELGIDIGSLDCVVISGYPGTIISTWQQAGRAGRSGESIVVLVAYPNPLDQYFMRHPRVFFDRSYEHAIVDLKNPYILGSHLLCAAYELPIKVERDKNFFGNEIESIIKILEDKNFVKKTQEGWVYIDASKKVHSQINLKYISSDVFKVICEDKLLETMDKKQAFSEAHKDAVIHRQGETFIVKDLNLENLIIQVEKKDVDYYTEVLKEVEVSILKEIEKVNILDFTFSFGEVEVIENYFGYKIKKFNSVIDSENLNLPPLNLKTMGLWLSISENLMEKIWEKKIKYNDKEEKMKKFEIVGSTKKYFFAGTLHGLEHAMIAITPFHVMCDQRDLGGASSAIHHDTCKPTIFIYDGYEGGIGLTEKAFKLLPRIIEMTYELVKDCRCEQGCPACVFSPYCGNENEPIDKIGTILLLKELVNVLIK